MSENCTEYLCHELLDGAKYDEMTSFPTSETEFSVFFEFPSVIKYYGKYSFTLDDWELG